VCRNSLAQRFLLFGFVKQDSRGTGHFDSFLNFDRHCNHWRGGPARLFCCLQRDLAPAFESLCRSGGQVSIGSAGKQRNDFDYSQFGAFLDRPFHAVEFENGEEESDLERQDLREFFTQL
jgi:hypothetical protein